MAPPLAQSASWQLIISFLFLWVGQQTLLFTVFILHFNITHEPYTLNPAEPLVEASARCSCRCSPFKTSIFSVFTRIWTIFWLSAGTHKKIKCCFIQNCPKKQAPIWQWFHEDLTNRASHIYFVEHELEPQSFHKTECWTQGIGVFTVSTACGLVASAEPSTRALKCDSPSNCTLVTATRQPSSTASDTHTSTRRGAGASLKVAPLRQTETHRRGADPHARRNRGLFTS